MTLEEAIEIVNGRPKNISLHWFVSKWNDGYIIHSSIYMQRYPQVEWVYSTAPSD